MNPSRITNAKKNSEGDITDVMLDNGDVYSINQAIDLARNGLIDGVNVGRSKSGREFLRSNPNGDKADNLDNLPPFPEWTAKYNQ